MSDILVSNTDIKVDSFTKFFIKYYKSVSPSLAFIDSWRKDMIQSENIFPPPDIKTPNYLSFFKNLTLYFGSYLPTNIQKFLFEFIFLGSLIIFFYSTQEYFFFVPIIFFISYSITVVLSSCFSNVYSNKKIKPSISSGVDEIRGISYQYDAPNLLNVASSDAAKEEKLPETHIGRHVLLEGSCILSSVQDVTEEEANGCTALVGEQQQQQQPQQQQQQIEVFVDSSSDVNHIEDNMPTNENDTTVPLVVDDSEQQVDNEYASQYDNDNNNDNNDNGDNSADYDSDYYDDDDDDDDDDGSNQDEDSDYYDKDIDYDYYSESWSSSSGSGSGSYSESDYYSGNDAGSNTDESVDN